MKLLQQACAANLKQWGMAIDLYSQDFDGTHYMSGTSSRLPWDDLVGYPTTSTNVYLPYVGGGDVAQRIRTMRTCPFVAAKLTQAQLNNAGIHNYSMSIPSVRTVDRPIYVSLAADNQNNYWPTLKFVSNPATYLLLMDSSHFTLSCHGLVAAVNGISYGDNNPPIARHGGAVNCLFGDFHVELVSSNRVAQQDAINCAHGNPWFEMN